LTIRKLFTVYSSTRKYRCGIAIKTQICPRKLNFSFSRAMKTYAFTGTFRSIRLADPKITKRQKSNELQEADYAFISA
jgi:hypothetical protein